MKRVREIKDLSAKTGTPPLVDTTVKDPPEKKNLAKPTELEFPFTPEEGQKKQQEWAAFLKRRAFETNSAGMKLALIPPGEFPMTPEYRVRLTKPFYLGVHEVTVGQFRQFVKETGHRTEAEVNGVGGFVDVTDGKPKPEYIWSNRDFSPTEQHPVVLVSWNDAERFCAWLSLKEKKTYRLPTSAEWQWASRAGVVPDPKTMQLVGWFAANSGKKSQPVGKLPANALGLFDMFGNVAEFCHDWFYADTGRPSPRGTVIDPKGPTDGERREVRGQTFTESPDPQKFGAFDPKLSMNLAGFRVACEVSPAEPPKIDPTPSIPMPPKFTNSLGMEFALIPKGKAWLGGRDGKPGNTVAEIPRDFYLGVYEVTQEEWQKVMGKNPGKFPGSGGEGFTSADTKRTNKRRRPVGSTACRRRRNGSMPVGAGRD